MKPWLAIAFAATGCTVSRDVLVDMVTSCPAALAGEPGEACAFEGVCSASDTAGSAAPCCTDNAYCRQGKLVVSHDCNPDCTPCVDDRQCQRGAAICDGTVCVPCDANPVCPTVCPAGWVHLRRNGCETCDCAPPSTCANAASSPCMQGICYTGADCAAGCAPNDLGCCSNQCESLGCPMPVPAGCLAQCPPAMSACATCATDQCQCVAGTWKCAVVCAPGLHSSCIAPPMATI